MLVFYIFLTEYLVEVEIDKDYNLILVQVDKNRMMIKMSRFYENINKIFKLNYNIESVQSFK